MKTITYVTGNDVKFERSAAIAASLGLDLQRAELDFEEIQGDGEAIARNKAEQAFQSLQRPVLVTDDSWHIFGLNGFPGAFMKQVNEWLTVNDWLNLTRPLKDRRITITQHLVYQDASGQRYYNDEWEGILLTESRGDSKHSKYPSLTITSFDGGKCSYAENVAAGIASTIRPSGAMHQLVEWLKTQPDN